MRISKFFSRIATLIENSADGEQDFSTHAKITFCFSSRLRPRDEIRSELAEAIKQVDREFPWESWDSRTDKRPPSIGDLSDGLIKSHDLGLYWLCWFKLTPGNELFRGNELREYRKYFEKFIQELAKKKLPGVFSVFYTIESSTSGSATIPEPK